MKRIIFFIALTVASLAAQSQPLKPGQVIAGTIARRMKDSLQLNTVQYKSVYQANLELFNRKTAAHKQFSNRDSLTLHIQKIENSRDKLYKGILDSTQFRVYKQKKISLISAH